MAHTEQLIQTLKRELRRRHVTYKHISEKLDLSEASVKRMFAHGQFTMERMAIICQMVDWDWVDLVTAARQNEAKLDHLTADQEKQIAEDIELFLVAVHVINGYAFDDLMEQYDFKETTLIQKLAQLDRLKLIELLPGNRIKLKISPNFRWNPRGPIQQYFLDVVVQHFFNSKFDGELEKLVVLNAMLSDTSHKQIQEKMDRLAAEFSEAMQGDRSLPLEDKKGNTLVLAMRHWKFAPFEAKARKKHI